MTWLEFLKQFLAKTLGIDETQAAALIKADGTGVNDTALQTLLDKDVARIQALTTDHAAKLKAAETKGFDNGVKKTKAELMTDFEKELKDKYNITSANTGLDLISDLEATFKKTAGDPTEAQIKKSKAYLDLEDAKKKELENTVKEWTDKWNDRDMKEKQTATTSDVRAFAVKKFKELNPVLASQEPAKVEKQMNLFIDRFISENDFQVDGEGEAKRIVIIDKVTKAPKVDGHSNRVEFDSFFTEYVKATYDITAADPKNSPPPPPGGTGGAPGAKKYAALGLKVPANNEEYVKGMTAIMENKTLKPDEQSAARAEFTVDYNAAIGAK